MQNTKFGSVSLFISSLVLSLGCTGGGGEGGGGSSITAAYLDFGEAFCACNPADEIQGCEANFQEAIGEISCEVAVYNREGQGSTVSCLTAQLRTTTNCFRASACDPEARDACLNMENACPEIPPAIEAEAQAECGQADFVCGDGGTIPADWVCDNEADCQDSSDEANCG
jgi:hypothetical protein